MLSPRWRKIVRELWSNKARTALIVLSTSVGVFAFGLITGSQAILERELARGYAATNPASARLYADHFDDDFVHSVDRMPEVAAAEGRHVLAVRIKVGSGPWVSLQLNALPNFERIRVSQIRPAGGKWPPETREILIERASLELIGAQIGDVVQVERLDGRSYELRVVGLAHDLQSPPTARFEGPAYGYINFDTLEALELPRGANELHVVVATNPLDRQHIQAVADRIKRRAENAGITIAEIAIPEPGKHPADNIIQSIVLLLIIFGLLSQLLNAFLITNMISALLAQQTRQIGIMKAIGARTEQIVALYLVQVLILGLIALGLAAPLVLVGARGFSHFVATSFNFDLASYALPPRVIGLQVAIALIVPLLAALHPVLAGTSVTVREAISSYGVGLGNTGKRRIAGLVERVRGLPRPLLLSLRNTFRRTGRLALTLVTLTLGGTIFIAIISLQASLFHTLDHVYVSYWNHDIQITFGQAYRAERIVHEVPKVPGVVDVEAWLSGRVRIVTPAAATVDAVLLGLPAATTMVRSELILVEGRWLEPKEEHSVVINVELLKDLPGVGVGDDLIVEIDRRRTVWRVVGIVRRMQQPGIGYAYANYSSVARALRSDGYATSAHIVTTQHDAAFATAVAQSLEDHFNRRGMPATADTTTAFRGRLAFAFQIIVAILLFMALLLAAVGGFSLMGTMSLNVLERTREIGVMRAIGASNGSVLQIFLVEGLLIGLISWCFAALFGLPMSRLLSDAIGEALLRWPLNFAFSIWGVLLWLGLVLVISAVSSLLPARHASRLTVREVLSYE